MDEEQELNLGEINLDELEPDQEAGQHKVDTKYVPAIVMLLAGAVASLTMIFTEVDTRKFLVTLLIVLIIFYIAGSVIKLLLDKSFKVMEVEEVELSGEELEFNDDVDDSFGDMDGDSYVVEERNS